MKLLEKLRSSVFWFIDFLRGGTIRGHYLEISKVLENYESEFSINNRREKLNNILQHAIDTVPFYNKKTALDNLKTFPVVNKEIIRDNHDLFKSAKFLDKKLNAKLTSGSTGVPFTVFHDINKIRRSIADTLYFANRSGYRLGQKLFYIRFWDESLQKSRAQKWIQNIQSYDVSNFQEEDIKKLITNIKSSNTEKGILAYASAYDRICNYLENSNEDLSNCNVSSIIAMSEPLAKRTKNLIRKHFNTPVFSRYSNIENGIIAQQDKKYQDDDFFMINWASFHIEVLCLDKDVAAESGELGRVVITDLFNYAVPMIRYDTGDLGIMISDHKNTEPYFSRIEGRKVDTIYDTKGKWVSSFIPTHAEEYEGVVQYQFIQEGEKDYRLRLVVDNTFNSEKKALRFLKSHFGDDAIILVEYVDEIPLLLSGKRKKIINTYHKL